jgi:hypothetical protein
VAHQSTVESIYEKQENALGNSGAGRIHRAAFGGVRSPASAKTEGTNIAHFGGKPRRERLGDDAEHERPARCANEQMSVRTLNPAH